MNRFNTEGSIGYVMPEDTNTAPDVASYEFAGYSRTQDSPLQGSKQQYSELYYKKSVPDGRILVFLTGFCLGMLFFYLCKGHDMDLKEVAGIFDREQIVRLQDFETYRTGLLEYIFGLRIKQLIFCCICALSSIGVVLAYVVIGWYGFELGLIIFSFVYQYGLKGIILTFSMFLPQGLFYLAAFLVLFGKYWMGSKKYYTVEEGMKGGGRKKKLLYIKKAVLIVILFVLGILCEAYINPEIMQRATLLF